MTLQVLCIKLDCRAPTATTEAKTGLCLDCQVDEACAYDRSELARLSKKRRQYQRRGIPTAAIEKQGMGVADRITNRIARMVSDPKRRQAAWLKVMGEATDSAHSRLEVPAAASGILVPARSGR